MLRWTQGPDGTGSGVDTLFSEVLDLYIYILYVLNYIDTFGACISIQYMCIHPCMQIVPFTCLYRTSFVALNCHVRAAVGVRP